MTAEKRTRNDDELRMQRPTVVTVEFYMFGWHTFVAACFLFCLNASRPEMILARNCGPHAKLG